MGSDKVILSIDGQEIVCQESETVLDAALRCGVPARYSCRNGICQSCMLRATAGQPSEMSQKGLKPAVASQGYFLACQHVPTESLTVSLDEAKGTYSSVSILSNEALSGDVYKISLSLPKEREYKTGQFVNLRKDSGEIRCYSLACVSEARATLELHVRLIRGGAVSTWLCNTANVGQKVEISEGRGDCVFVPDRSKADKPILLMGTGTGLSSLYGTINIALESNHSGEIFLYHGASKKHQLYLVDELLALEDRHPNFHYVPCVSGEAGSFGFREGRSHDLALKDNKELKEYLVFTCGNPEMVRSAKRRAYMQGATLHNIFGDAFVRAHASNSASESGKVNIRNLKFTTSS